MQRAIFISYRRSDSEGEAGRLSDVLSHRFTDQAVFMDVDAIQPGRDFRKAIEESIQACAVLLTVIGPQWLEATNSAGERRLEETNDYVRLEIAAALRRDIPVIPVLVRGARVPAANRLPPEIQDLAYRNGVGLTHSRWKSDLQVLIRALEPFLEITEPLIEVTKPSLQGTSAPVVPAVPATPATQHRPAIQPSSLVHVTRLLAHYIGPIAEVIVKRSVPRHQEFPRLCEALAQEIEDPIVRREFLSKATAEVVS